LIVVFIGDFGGTVLLFLVRTKHRLLAATLLLVSASFGLAIAFVALDSATYVGKYGCGFFGCDNSPPEGTRGHVYYLYVLWGMAVGFLLWAALLNLVRTRRPRPSHAVPPTE
jgi:hypothetical protein